MRKYCKPQIFIPEDRQMEVWRQRNPWALLHGAVSFLQCRESKSFHKANSNINRCTNKIYIFHTYTIGMIQWKWDNFWRVMRTSFLFNMVVNTNARTDRHNTWLFQVCKHLISCILQCAIRDHWDHICCKLKHLKVEMRLWIKNRQAAKRRWPSCSLNLGGACSTQNQKMFVLMCGWWIIMHNHSFDIRELFYSIELH